MNDPPIPFSREPPNLKALFGAFTSSPFKISRHTSFDKLPYK